jgi:hypothetical protein
MAKKETKPTTTGRKPARKPATRSARSRKPEVSHVTHDAISDRAYEIYLSGSTAGAFADWMRAEHELRV